MRKYKMAFALFYQLLDLCMVNACLLYRIVMTIKRKRIEVLSKSKFRTEVVEYMCNIAIKGTHQLVRPNSYIEQNIQSKRHKGYAQPMPSNEVRTDQVAHWSMFAEKRTKFPNCNGFTDIICEKCGVVLCFNYFSPHSISIHQPKKIIQQ